MDVMAVYSCIFCNEKFEGYRKYAFHMGKYGDQKMRRFECPYCFSTLMSSKNFSLHLKRHENKGHIIKRISTLVPPHENSSGENHADYCAQNSASGNSIDHPQPSTSQENPSNEPEQTVTSNNSEVNFNDEVSDYIMNRMIHFYCKPNTPLTNATEISQMVMEIMNFTRDQLQEGISKCTSLEEAQQFVEQVDIDDSKFRSKHMFQKHLSEAGVFFNSRKFIVSRKLVHYEGEQEMQTYHGIVMPIKDQIKTFLQLPGILNTMLKNQEQFVNGNFKEEPLAHFCSGSLWKGIVKQNLGKTLIPIMLYSDDFTIDNGIGPHASDNQICGFYYQFPSLPNHLRSKLKHIFVAMLALTKHIKEFSPDSALYMLLDVFTDLEENGMDVCDETGRVHKIHIVLTNLLGDNLGIHVICGFMNFNSRFYCRFCLTPKRICKYLTSNANMDLRTIEGYNEMFENESFMNFGIRRKCVLSDLKSFHILNNLSVDIMHDLMLGVLKYDLKMLLGYYTTGNLLDLNLLNYRIKKWNFGYKETIKITPIKKNHLNKSSSIHMNAKEIWFLVENLPLLLNGLIPQNEYYDFMLMVHDLMDICLQPQFDEESLNLMDEIIKNHHYFYNNYFSQNLTPKYHFMLHYRDVIERCGPLKEMMCFRLESKHQELKSYTNVSHNRRNVLVSLANKQMFRFSDTLLNFDPECLHNLVTPVSKVNMKLVNETVLETVKLFLMKNNKTMNKFICTEKIKYKGTPFGKGEYLIINDDFAALIAGVIVADTSVVVLYHNTRILYEESLRCYAVLEKDESMVLFKFINNFEYVPVPENVSMGVHYIKKLKRY